MAVKQTAAAAALHAATVANGAPLTSYTYTPAAPVSGPTGSAPAGSSAQIYASLSPTPINQIGGNPTMPDDQTLARLIGQVSGGSEAQNMNSWLTWVNNWKTTGTTGNAQLDGVLNQAKSGGTVPTTSQGTSATYTPGQGVTNVTNTVNGMAAAISSKPMLDPTGKFFQTNDPATDKFLNEIYLPLIEQQMASNPAAYYDSQAFKNIKDTVETTWGPVFANELNTVKQKFDLASSTLGAEKKQFTTKYGTSPTDQGTTITRGLEDLAMGQARTAQDVATKTQRIARSYTEAVRDSQDALAGRNLVSGGTRIRAEAGLANTRDTNLADLTSTSTRTLEDLQKAQARSAADTTAARDVGLTKYANEATGLQNDLTTGNQAVDAERLAKQAEERQRLVGLGGQLVKSNAAIY